MIMQFFEKNSSIEAGDIQLGKSTAIGRNVSIKVQKKFSLGDYSKIGDNVIIRGEEVRIGEHFFHTDGLVVGGGGSQFYEAVLKVGDRCVMHNNYINLCRPVLIGNDVGLSPDCQIITHGFWKSVLEGFPVKYDGVQIDDGVIIGQRSMILMGVHIAKNCVIGAQSVVSSCLTQEKSVYAGNPARWIRTIVMPTEGEQREHLNTLIRQYREFIVHYYALPKVIIDFPYLHIREFVINVLTGESSGVEDRITDDLRDFLRRYGVRVYTERPFGRVHE